MIYDSMVKVICEVLHVEKEDVTKETAFATDLGADSLDLYQLVMALELEFDVELSQSAEDVTVTTVEELYDKLRMVMQM